MLLLGDVHAGRGLVMFMLAGVFQGKVTQA